MNVKIEDILFYGGMIGLVCLIFLSIICILIFKLKKGILNTQLKKDYVECSRVEFPKILQEHIDKIEYIEPKYNMISKINSGGSANIYRAFSKSLKKDVVLKIYHFNIVNELKLRRREVDILKNLRHSYIVQVYDFFEDEEKGIAYTVMDYIEGQSFEELLRCNRKFSQSQVIKWTKQLLEAISYLYNSSTNEEEKYIHGDIKPANIMCTTNQDICLIDFNISVISKEKETIGYSIGYSAPEYYGIDFSTLDDTNLFDMHSDIYSIGATMFHLLSGKRPIDSFEHLRLLSVEKMKQEIPKLSEEDFKKQLYNIESTLSKKMVNKQIIEIILKAMNPNPNLRYQKAEEMLNALNDLKKNDSRTRKLKRNGVGTAIILFLFLCTGIMSVFVGLKRMEVIERWLKVAEYSQTALAEGDSITALNHVMEAFPVNKTIFTPAYIPEAQKALTNILGVYDLGDGFKKYKVVELPSNPLYMILSPNGKIAACVCSGFVVVFDTETATVIATLQANKSALSEIEYLDNNTIIYAGVDGIEVYDILKDIVVWTGELCTAISISQDRETVAAIYKNQDFATVYDTVTGSIIKKIEFDGKYQNVTVNDSFANPKDNLFEINEDGSLLVVSFSDGSLEVYDLHTGDVMQIQNDTDTSKYTHFEGGFYKQYLAFSMTNEEESILGIIDTVKKVETVSYSGNAYIGVNTDENGVYVQQDNCLVKMHPVTGEQTPLVTTSKDILDFAISDTHTLVTAEESIMFFDSNANLTSSFEKETGDFLQIANGIALIGTMNTSKIKIMKYENHSEKEVFTYNSLYEHDEARISADRKTVMLFTYKQFHLYKITGELIKEVTIPNARQVYDQQFIRRDGESYLEVTYNDGTRLTYSAKDGNLISKEKVKQPDLSLYEEFYTDFFRIESPLHGSSKVYDINTSKLLYDLNEDGYLAYVTQVGDYIITQYITTDDEYYGVLLNNRCETLAYLPYLSDIFDGELYFDYPTGNMRKSRIYNVNELIKMGQKELIRHY